MVKMLASAHPQMAIFADFGVGQKFNPRNINPMPAVKIFARLERDETISFLDGH
jgi:hypothetical protein